MKVDQLLYFIEVARTEHVGRAASALSISPSAISHSISSLEQELGCRLIENRGKNIFLTNHGKRFAQRATPILLELTRLKEEMSSEDVEPTGSFRIAATHGLAATLLTPAWAQVQRRHPGLSAEVLSLISAEVVARIARAELDAGVCYSPQPHPEVTSRILQEGSLRIVVRRGHPLLKVPASQRLKGLSLYPQVSPKAFQGIENCERHPLLRKLGIQSDVRFIFDSYDVGLQQLRISDSWGYFPEQVLAQSRGELAELLASEKTRAPVSIVLLWPRKRPLVRALKELEEVLLKSFVL